MSRLGTNWTSVICSDYIEPRERRGEEPGGQVRLHLVSAPISATTAAAADDARQTKDGGGGGAGGGGVSLN